MAERDFKWPKDYLLQVLSPEQITLHGNEIATDEVDMTQALAALTLALEDGTRHGKKKFKEGFEAGRRPFGFGMDIQAGKPIYLICLRCGMKFRMTAKLAPDPRCPKCGERNQSE